MNLGYSVQRESRRGVLGALAWVVGGVCASHASAQITVNNLTYNPNNGHWYGRVDDQGIYWRVARAQANMISHNGVRGHLMTFHNGDEQNISRFSLGTVTGFTYWIGAYQVGGPEPVGTWAWVTNESWSYNSWPPGYPNNFYTGVISHCPDEDVAGMIGYWGWWDDFCSKSNDPSWYDLIFGYLIEFPSAQIDISPPDVYTMPGTDGPLVLVASGVLPTSVQWQIESPPGTWVSLSSAPTPLAGGGSASIQTPSSGTALINIDGVTGVFSIRAQGANSFETITSNLIAVTVGAVCDSVDFNGDGFFPDTADIDDYLSVFSGGPCSTGTCGDTDFNNDGLYPDTMDIDALLSVFSGGPCL